MKLRETIARIPSLTRADLEELLLLVQASDGAAKRRLATAHLHLVWQVAAALPVSSQDEAVAVGTVALLEAIESYRGACGAFVPYARRCIHGQIATWARDARDVRRVGTRKQRSYAKAPARVSMDVALGVDEDEFTRHDVIADERAEDPESTAITRDYARKTWARLNASERRLVTEIVTGEEASNADKPGGMAAAARKLGVSRERVRQQRQAIASRMS